MTGTDGEDKKTAPPLKVGIDARLISGTAGGVEQFIVGLAYGLSQLTEGREEYHFLAYSNEDRWIKPHLSGACRILHCTRPLGKSTLRQVIKERSPGLYRLSQKVYPVSERWKIHNLWSDGTIEKANIDVMHFTHQVAFLTKVPCIYHPHDLQHKHFPQYFSMNKRLIRELLYRLFCRRARLVAVVSDRIKSDLIRFYNLSQEKVKVVHLAPVVSAYQKPTLKDIAETRSKFSLPDAYIFYPAQTWPHKNHVGLLKAVEIIRERFGVVVPVVFAGSIYEPFFKEIQQQIQKLSLSKQIHVLGFVTPVELQCLYQLARGVVIPSKYEAGSFPLWEAFLSGVPAACSNVTSLPAQAGDAALIFDPDQPEEIADAIVRLWKEESLRQKLIDRGYQNVARYSWQLTARTFRAYYRQIAKRLLTEEDFLLLKAPSLM